MSLSPGLVNSCFELLSLVDRRPVSVIELRASFTSIGVVSSVQVIEYSQKMRWIVTNDSGMAEVTHRGHRFLTSEPLSRTLRLDSDVSDPEKFVEEFRAGKLTHN